MKKFILKNLKCDDFFMILHAFPDMEGDFRWYITKNKDSKGKVLKEQHFESICLSSFLIRECNMEGKYLYCRWKNKNFEVKKSEVVKLSAKFFDALKNISFDTIEMVDENGDIIPYPLDNKNINC